jgi:Ca-activated chloride channel family protein
MADSSTVAEGGEIGTGHSIVSVFEVELKNDSVPVNAILADAGLTYLPFAEKEKRTEIYSVKNNYRSLSQCDSSYRFESAVTWFGLLLRQSPYVNSNSWNDLIQLLSVSVNANDKWQKEMQMLVLKAKEIYKPDRKKIFFKKKKG